MAKILVIEDDVTTRFAVVKALRKGVHDVSEAPDIADARKQVAETAFDLILTDLRLSVDDDGIEYIRELREGAEAFDGVVVAMTGNASIESAVRAMKNGADDYLTKPLLFEELALSVPRWLEQRRLRQRVRLYERLERSRTEDFEALGNSPEWLVALDMAARLARIPLPPVSESVGPSTLPCILLLGETGAGKGVLARHIHAEAARLATEGEPPFVHVNCSALPATLVESELFGHERGAFTDAREARPGLFEMAEGGTIFLDEISEMPPELQTKLLVVVERGRYRRIGGARDKRVRARVIAASNQDLAQRAADGRFRRDLLYRLNAFTITIPPLRDRAGDAVLIAEAALSNFARRYGREAPRLSDGARAAIAACRWPGNVRELVNAMQRVSMLFDGDTVDAEDLGLAPELSRDEIAAEVPSLARLATGELPKAEDLERELVMEALRKSHGNVSRAARLIGLTRAGMRYRVEQFGLAEFVKETAQR